MALSPPLPSVDQRRLNKRNPQQPSQTAYWHPVYRGYAIYQHIERGPQVRNHLDRAFELLRALQHHHSQVFAFRVDLRFPVDLEDPALYADNQPIRGFLKALNREVQGLTGQRDPALYVAWAREHNDQSRRRHVTDADLKDGEADLTRPHYHLFIAVHFAAFRRLGSFEPSYDGHYGGRSLAHAVIRSWQRVLGRNSEHMPGLAHFAKSPESGKIQTFVIRRQDGPEGLIAPMKAISYLCKAYSKDTGKGVRTFQTCRIEPAIREAIWKQEKARQEAVGAPACYQAAHRGCTHRYALDDATATLVRDWLLRPLLQARTGDSGDWALHHPGSEISDLVEIQGAERRVKQLASVESLMALEQKRLRIDQRGTAFGQAQLIADVLAPAWRFFDHECRERRWHGVNGIQRRYDPVVARYRQAFEPVFDYLQRREAREAPAIKRLSDLDAIYRHLRQCFYAFRGALARPEQRAAVVQARQRIDALMAVPTTLVDTLLARHAGLQGVMLQLGHLPCLFPATEGVPLALSQQAFHQFLATLQDAGPGQGLAGLFWKRDAGAGRQHVIHVAALYSDTRQSVEQRRRALADHWIHPITRGEGVAYRLHPTSYNRQHLLTPDLDWVAADGPAKRDALLQQLQALIAMDHLTYLALPDNAPRMGTWRPDTATPPLPS